MPPEQWPDPHPHYHRMRAETPIKAFPEWDEYVLTRWADCERVLRDPTMSSDPDSRAAAARLPGVRRHGAPASMLMMDPPDHTRLRKLVSKAFTPRTVEQLRPHVAELVDGMLDEADPAGFDLIAADRLPAAGHRDLRAARHPRRGPAPVRAVELATRPACSTATSTRPPSSAGCSPSCRSVNYLNGIFEERRANPRDDLLVRAARGRGGGRQALRGGAALHRGAAVRGRPRDHHEPHRQRHRRPAPPARRVGPARRRPVAGARRGRGGAPLRRPGPPHRAHRHRADPGRRRRWSSPARA